MPDIGLDIEVREGDIIQDIHNDIRDGARKGSAEVMVEAEETAKQRIRNVGAIFTGDLIRSFDMSFRTVGTTIIVKLENTSEHAAPIEYGAEYTEEGPPVVALIPWVEVKMRGFQLPDDEVDLSELESKLQQEDTEIPEAHGDVTDLADVVDQETIEKAFWLQQHIKREGIDAVRFMKRAQMMVNSQAADDIADAISRELRT